MPIFLLLGLQFWELIGEFEWIDKAAFRDEIKILKITSKVGFIFVLFLLIISYFKNWFNSNQDLKAVLKFINYCDPEYDLKKQRTGHPGGEVFILLDKEKINKTVRLSGAPYKDLLIFALAQTIEINNEGWVFHETLSNNKNAKTNIKRQLGLDDIASIFENDRNGSSRFICSPYKFTIEISEDIKTNRIYKGDKKYIGALELVERDIENRDSD